MKVFHIRHIKKPHKNIQKQVTVTSGLKNSIMWYLSHQQMLMFLKLETMPTYEGQFFGGAYGKCQRTVDREHD